MATNVTPSPNAALGTALQGLLALLGVNPAVGAIVVGLVAAANAAPEIIALLEQDLELFKKGVLTPEELQARFRTSQETFERAAARWRAETPVQVPQAAQAEPDVAGAATGPSILDHTHSGP